MMSHGKVLSKWNEAKRLLDCWIVYICIGTLLPRELINWRSTHLSRWLKFVWIEDKLSASAIMLKKKKVDFSIQKWFVILRWEHCRKVENVSFWSKPNREQQSTIFFWPITFWLPMSSRLFLILCTSLLSWFFSSSACIRSFRWTCHQHKLQSKLRRLGGEKLLLQN